MKIGSKDLQSMRLLEIILGIAVLAVLCILIVVVINDNKEIRNDREWLSAKFQQLLSSNAELQRRLLSSDKDVQPSAILESAGYELHVVSGYLVPADPSNQEACDVFAVTSVIDSNSSLADLDDITLDASHVASDDWALIEASGATDTLNVVIAEMTDRSDECGAGIDVLAAW